MTCVQCFFTSRYQLLSCYQLLLSASATASRASEVFLFFYVDKTSDGLECNFNKTNGNKCFY
jgi:hypothetical protein